MFLLSGCASVGGAGAGAGAGVSGTVAGAAGLIYGAYAIGKMINEYERKKEYVSVLNHMSTSLKKPKIEPKGFGLYTYVFLGERPRAVESPCDSASYSRECKYERVLYEVQKNSSYIKRKHEEKRPLIEFDRSNYNLFLIPSSSNVKFVDLKSYNYDLSFSYLESLNYASNGKFGLLKREGPFLVSLTKPISFREKDAYALYVDLSDSKPEIIEEILSSYKQRLQSSNGNKPFSSLESIKADFIKYMVDFNDDIAIFLDPSS
jgi:hypothetical protein